MAASRATRGGDGGSTVVIVAALGLAALVMVALLNVLVYMYGRGAARSSIDQAARAGSRASATQDVCEQRAHEALDALMGGPLGEDVTVTCRDDGDQVQATATGTFHGWIEIVPDWSWSITATAEKEQGP